jgi:tetratricopeptide (TPR) repeat protein
MRTRSMILLIPPLVLAALAAQANSGGSMRAPAPSTTQEQSPADRAVGEFNEGLSYLKKGDKLEAEAAGEADSRKLEKAQKRSHDAYNKARKEFQEATEYNPQMPEAWNDLGYTQRKLGDYNASLASYEKALALRPGYPEAIEYRAEAYLGVDRVEDAKSAYMDLFANNRALSNQLLTAIKNWVDVKRHDGKLDSATLEQAAQWVEERSRIASQTAALTREGTAASWK